MVNVPEEFHASEEYAAAPITALRWWAYRLPEEPSNVHMLFVMFEQSTARLGDMEATTGYMYRVAPHGDDQAMRKLWSYDGAIRTTDGGTRDAGNFTYAVVIRSMLGWYGRSNRAMHLEDYRDELLGDIIEAVLAFGYYRRKWGSAEQKAHWVLMPSDIEEYVEALEYAVVLTERAVGVLTRRGHWHSSRDTADELL